MRNIKVRELEVGNIFTESLQLKHRESFRVSCVDGDTILTIGNNSGRVKEFKTDQIKQVILLKENGYI